VSRPAFLPYRKRAVEDLTGQRFGLLTVIGPAQSLGTGARWKCRCDCGVERFKRGCELREKPPETHRTCRLTARAKESQ